VFGDKSVGLGSRWYVKEGRDNGSRCSCSDRQPSTVTMSDWPAMRNFPSNICEMGDLTELAYLCPCIFVNNGPSGR
jgi:hypothetical protein